MCIIETCGDGTVNNSGAEQCDDGNNIADDGCSPICTFEAYCGNAIIDPGETCEINNDCGTARQDVCLDCQCDRMECNEILITDSLGQPATQI